MLPKISRYLLIIAAVVVLSYILPSIYHTFYDVRIGTPRLAYSALKQEFFASKYINGKSNFTDSKGNNYTREDYMDALVIDNFSYHLTKGTLPDSLNGQRLHPNQLQFERFYQGTGSMEFDQPEYELYPLYESASDFGLAAPKDFFTMKDRMEFTIAKTNEVDEVKSNWYTKVLLEAGFQFPAKVLGGMATILKSRDDGWFVMDSKNDFYHIKMIKGEPFVKQIAVPNDFSVKKIICSDHPSREFYATIVTTDNDLYLLLQDDYKLQRLPIEDFNAATQSITITGNLFNKVVTLFDNNFTKAYALDRGYQKVDEFFEAKPQRSEMTVGKLGQILFPFMIHLKSGNSMFIDFYTKGFKSIHWIYLNVFLLLIAIFIINRQHRSIKNNILDLMLIATTGIFGFIAVQIFPNKEY